MFTQHYPGVLAYVRRRTTDDPGDAVSEVFLTAWRRFDDVPDDALPWLLGVARRVLANTRRSAARRPALPVANVDAALESSAQERLEVAEAFSRLGERDREALMLVAWDGLPPERAARALGCSATAFRVRLHRARGRLERALGDADPGHARDESAQELSTPREAE